MEQSFIKRSFAPQESSLETAVPAADADDADAAMVYPAAAAVAATTFLSFIDPGENVFLIFTIVSSLQYGLSRGQCVSLSLAREDRP